LVVLVELGLQDLVGDNGLAIEREAGEVEAGRRRHLELLQELLLVHLDLVRVDVLFSYIKTQYLTAHALDVALQLQILRLLLEQDRKVDGGLGLFGKLLGLALLDLLKGDLLEEIQLRFLVEALDLLVVADLGEPEVDLLDLVSDLVRRVRRAGLQNFLEGLRLRRQVQIRLPIVVVVGEGGQDLGANYALGLRCVLDENVVGVAFFERVILGPFIVLFEVQRARGSVSWRRACSTWRRSARWCTAGSLGRCSFWSLPRRSPSRSGRTRCTSAGRPRSGSPSPPGTG